MVGPDGPHGRLVRPAARGLDLGHHLAAGQQSPLVEERRLEPVTGLEHGLRARVPRPLKAPERELLRDWSSEWARAVFGDIPVEHVRLMRSQLGGGPARYTTLTTFDLQ